MILSCINICKSFGDTQILKNIQFLIEDKEKTALVGVNGAGKTTLFKILTGEQTPDDGTVIYSKDLKNIGYLAQMLDLDGEETIFSTLRNVFAPLLQLEEEIRLTEKNMAHLDGTELAKAMEKYSRLTHHFEDQKGYEYQSRIRGVIKGLGFSEEDANKQIKLLSGGQKTRVSLGKLLLTNPQLLLLDEPTNHLDIESIEWLEDFLKNYDGSVLLISHDRYFMNKIVTKVIEIENQQATVYLGNYTQFAEKKEIQRQVQLKQYVDQQKEIKKQEEVIKTLRSFNREKSIKRAESREKMLDKMARVEKPEDLPDTMHFAIEPKLSSGNDVLDVLSLSKSFGAHHLFEDISFSIKKQEKVALIGPNGVGKTTLFKILLNMLPQDAGKIKIGTNVTIGYYDQGQQNLDPEKTIFDEISDTYKKLTVLEIRNALAAFVFTADDVFKKISTLSGGEKGRVALAKIMLSQANVLLLDEPTNHLDMLSKEILEKAIQNYKGTVFYISHDRYFINHTATKILDLSPHSMHTYLGNYDYYLEKRIVLPTTTDSSENEAAEKNSWTEKKGRQSDERKRKTQIRNVENQITKLEEAVADLEQQLNTHEVATQHVLAAEIFAQKAAMEETLEELMLEWETLSE